MLCQEVVMVSDSVAGVVFEMCIVRRKYLHKSSFIIVSPFFCFSIFTINLCG